jgi:hypothetical protein
MIIAWSVLEDRNEFDIIENHPYDHKDYNHNHPHPPKENKGKELQFRKTDRQA